MLTRTIPVRSQAPIAASAFVTAGDDLVLVVKATLALEHDREATLTAPRPLLQTNAWRPSGALDGVNELTTPMERACVLLRGHAYAPAGTQAQSVSAWLRVIRGEPLVDKLVYAVGDRTQGSAPRPFERMPLMGENAAWAPDNPTGIHPSSGRLASLTNARPGATSAHFGPVLETDPRSPPAPPDQRFGALVGDEWIVLDGMHPVLPRVASKLPGLIASARLRTATAAGARVRLRCEMLNIDADALIATLIWRVRLAQGCAMLGPAEVEVSLERGDTMARSANVGAQHGDGPSDVDETLVPTAAQLARALARPATPFGVAPPPMTPRGVGLNIPGAPWSGIAAPPSPSGSVDETMAIPLLSFAPAATDGGQRLASPSIEPKPSSISDSGLGPPRHESETSPRIEARSVAAGATPEPPAIEDVPGATAPEPSPLRAELDARLRGGRSLHGLDLKGANLEGMTLDGASLSGLDLSHARLARCSLREVRLSDASLIGADLREAELSGADLSRANLRNAIIEGAKLDGAALLDANLERADSEGARFTRANLSRANLRFINAAGADFTEATLAEADLKQARLQGAVLDGAILKGAIATRADLSGASLVSADLRDAMLRDSRLCQCKLNHAKLDNADLQGADLTETDLRGSTRVGIKMFRAITRGWIVE